MRETYKVVIYDVDDFNNIHNYEGHDVIGYLEFTLHEVVTSRDQTLIRNLDHRSRSDGKSGVVKITGEETKRGEVTELIMKPRASLSGWSGLNFFIIMKLVGQNMWKPVYKSEKKNILNGFYDWQMVNMNTADVVEGGNVDGIFKFEFYQSMKSGKHKNIGHVELTLAQAQQGECQFQLKNKKNKILD